MAARITQEKILAAIEQFPDLSFIQISEMLGYAKSSRGSEVSRVARKHGILRPRNYRFKQWYDSLTPEQKKAHVAPMRGAARARRKK